MRLRVHFVAPDIVPIFNETLHISPDSAIVLPVQMHQVKVVRVVDGLVLDIVRTSHRQEWWHHTRSTHISRAW